MATKKPKIHLTVHVSLADFEFIPGNPGHCPIAQALQEADRDILSPRVTDKKIMFSRRSTGLRYTYVTPLNAARFIRAADAILETKKVPEDITVVLTDQDLIRAEPRMRRDPVSAIRQANLREATVKVKNGKVTVEPPHPRKTYTPRPKRLNTVAV
jgi:hypothetical protein